MTLIEKLAAAEELDAWCVKQIARFATLFDGEEDRDKRNQALGEHRALMRMRSYIHGQLRSHQGKVE